MVKVTQGDVMPAKGCLAPCWGVALGWGAGGRGIFLGSFSGSEMQSASCHAHIPTGVWLGAVTAPPQGLPEPTVGGKLPRRGTHGHGDTAVGVLPLLLLLCVPLGESLNLAVSGEGHGIFFRGALRGYAWHAVVLNECWLLLQAGAEPSTNKRRYPLGSGPGASPDFSPSCSHR